MALVDSLTSEARSKHMGSIRSSNTKLEDKVTHTLWKKGIRFRKNTKSLPGKPDISIKKYKIVIFIDSCFWHSCDLHGRIPKSNTDFWTNKITKNKLRDEKITDYYLSNGWRILRVWEHDILSNFQITIEKIANFINDRKKECP